MLPRAPALFAIALLVGTALADALADTAPDFGTLDNFTRTLKEQPFKVVVDRRACGETGVYVQVLGAGGPELEEGWAASSYIVWVDGQARVLVDAGPGSAAHFREAGGQLADLDAILISHLHVDHSADLAAYLKLSRFTQRSRPLPIYGPSGGKLTPGFNEWLRLMFGPRGAYRYLADLLSPLTLSGFEIVPKELSAEGRKPIHVLRHDRLAISAMPTDHGPFPALAWRVNVDGVGITFTGDTANRRQTLATFATDSALLIAHHAVPEGTRGSARELHMPPSQIGKLATEADVNMVILSHRMSRTLRRMQESRELITRHFKGPVVFANDLDCWET